MCIFTLIGLCLIYLIGPIKFLHVLSCLFIGDFYIFAGHGDKHCIYLRALNIIFVKQKHHKRKEFDDSVLDLRMVSHLAVLT